MEDVLDVYQRPHDPARPVVCLDETTKQLLKETRAPIPATPGRKARHDYEYERNGVANLFMMFAPLEGWRHVEVTDRRLLDERGADRERDPDRLLVFARDFVDEALEQPHRERDVDRRVEQDHVGGGLGHLWPFHAVLGTAHAPLYAGNDPLHRAASGRQIPERVHSRDQAGCRIHAGRRESRRCVLLIT
mgnify:CR=1 FL=1